MGVVCDSHPVEGPCAKAWAIGGGADAPTVVLIEAIAICGESWSSVSVAMKKSPLVARSGSPLVAR